MGAGRVEHPQGAEGVGLDERAAIGGRRGGGGGRVPAGEVDNRGAGHQRVGEHGHGGVVGDVERQGPHGEGRGAEGRARRGTAAGGRHDVEAGARERVDDVAADVAGRAGDDHGPHAPGLIATAWAVSPSAIGVGGRPSRAYSADESKR